ncbi:hypothetical protein [Algibacter mikhailovii]|uniref:DUF4179 domain-containing protein n=1 Tax=Algibacter mikhailovii TaxID=425498 RepID=A0A918VAP3_9FLAO|nr:hypothetical protein [Algibacter mikhailovii]GGZ86953.1 hypothetical protein GCM10007028_26340 [Algibacter mikhailovii]
MSKDSLDNIFKSLEHDFDIEVPKSGHEMRFQDKLNNQNNKQTKVIRLNTTIWKSFLGIAASIVLLITLFIGINQQEEVIDLASVSPEMAKTQDFFTASIDEELKKLQKESSPEVQIIIQDALKRIKLLENDYESLKIDLKNSGEDNRVIYAMISNFQNRIDILQNTLEQINIVKQLNNSSNEIPESTI